MTTSELGGIILNIILFYILVGIPTACFTAVVANSKGYRTITWLFGGFFFTFIALIAMAGMPVKQSVAPPKN